MICHVVHFVGGEGAHEDHCEAHYVHRDVKRPWLRPNSTSLCEDAVAPIHGDDAIAEREEDRLEECLSDGVEAVARLRAWEQAARATFGEFLRVMCTTKNSVIRQVA